MDKLGSGASCVPENILCPVWLPGESPHWRAQCISSLWSKPHPVLRTLGQPSFIPVAPSQIRVRLIISCAFCWTTLALVKLTSFLNIRYPPSGPSSTHCLLSSLLFFSACLFVYRHRISHSPGCPWRRALWSSCFNSSRSGTIGVYYHTWLPMSH